MLHREFYRRGPHHQRDGDATFGMIRQRFDFRSIQIGKWVKEAEKQKAAPLFYDALCDLMLILGANEPLISLRGTLALQYGCGGQPGVMAHYEPATRSFSLAKNAGPGSIAHEWFHGFDHYIVDKAFHGAAKGDFASHAWLDDVSTVDHPLNELLSQCFQIIILNEAGDAPSEYFKQSALMDKKTKGYYFSKPEEMCARAFEAFVQDAPIKNNFLVKGTKQSEEAKLGLYPQGEHRLRINAAFKQYFHTLGHVLKRQGENHD
ncbi:MAG: hypothetical protein CL679_03925 [Bermanella sp.]|nr:hypothetical protein [Bermanella sp.]